MARRLYMCPKTGGKHIQGYVRLDDAVRKGKFRKIIGPNAKGKKDWYMAKACADWTKNAKYTSKDDKVVFHKCPPVKHQGCRTDLVEFRDAVKRKASDTELFEDHLSCIAKCPRLEHRLKQSYGKSETREFRKLEVIMHWGAAGTGKTRKHYEEGAYLFDDYEAGWWDGYDGESVICFDDFYGGCGGQFLAEIARWLSVQIEGQGGLYLCTLV